MMNRKKYPKCCPFMVGFAPIACLLLGCATTSSLRAREPVSAPFLHGLVIGSSRLKDALLAFGPATVAALRGQDQGLSGDPNGPVYLYYEAPFEPVHTQRASYWLLFDNADCRLREVRVTFVGTMVENVPTDAVVKEVFGSPDRRGYRRLLGEEWDEAQSLSDCDDPTGEIESWFYLNLGLEVQFYRQSREVRVLSFGARLTTGDLPSPCPTPET